MALCTVDEAKTYLNVDGNMDADEELVENLIDRVSYIFEIQCDRVFDSTEHTEYLDGEGREWIRPKHYPITAVTGLWDSTTWDWDDDTLISSDDYKVSNSGRFIKLKARVFYDGSENVKITYTAGYSTIPLDLKMACIDEVARLYRSRDERHLTNYSNTDGENYVYDLMAFSDMTKKTLNRYMNR